MTRVIERACKLDSYSEEALAATDRWVVGISAGHPAEQLATAVGADSKGETGFISETFVLQFPAGVGWAEAASRLGSEISP